MNLHDQAQPATLRIGRVADSCRVLGPGDRTVIWVAGCPLRCRECTVPELLDMRAGSDMAVDELAERILHFDATRGIDGVTFSGGEPFAQASALAVLVRRLRATRPNLSVMSYSGYTLERLRRRGDAGQLALLAQLDILIDGPYLPHRHAPLRWRGSSNQRIHWLTDRHRDLEKAPDAPAGMVWWIDDEDRFYWDGVPPVRGLRQQIELSLASEGIEIGA